MSEAEARAFCDRLRVELENHGTRLASISTDVRAAALRAESKLAPMGKSIDEAVDFFVAHLEASKKSVRVSELVDRFLEAKNQDGVSKTHARDLRLRLGRLVQEFGPYSASELSTAGLDDWLRGLPFGPQTRNHFRSALHGLFEYARKRKFVTVNPVVDTDRARVPAGEKRLLLPEEMERIFKHAPARLIAYLAIAAFVGPRPSETMRIRAEHVDLKRGKILIEGRKTTASDREVGIPYNLRCWLERYPVGASGAAGRWRKHLDKTLVDAKVKLAYNGFRRSAGSYTYAMSGDAAATAAMLGHSDVRTFFKHYRRNVAEETALRWFGLMPPELGKIIELPSAG